MDIFMNKTGLALHEDKENGIEILLRFVEILRINDFNHSMINQLEKIVLETENLLIRIEEEQSNTVLLIYAKRVLAKFGKALIEENINYFRQNISIKLIINYLFAFLQTIKKSLQTTDSYLLTFNFQIFSLNRYIRTTIITPDNQKRIDKLSNLKFKYNNELTNSFYNKISKIFNINTVFQIDDLYDLADYNLDEIKNLDFSSFSIFIDPERKANLEIKLPYPEFSSGFDELQWEINIRIIDERSLHKVGYLLYIVGSTLESIKGVKAVIAEFSEGSLFVKIKVFFKDLVAKEETKEVLNKARDAVKAHYLDRPVEEVNHMQKDSFKIDAETRFLESQIDLLKSDEAKQNQKLDLESKVLDNTMKTKMIEEKELDIKLKQLDYIDKLSNLLKSGLVHVDDLQISINEVLYLSIENNKFILGASMDNIEKGDTDIIDESTEI